MISKTECRTVLGRYSGGQSDEDIDKIIKILNMLAELEYKIINQK